MRPIKASYNYNKQFSWNITTNNFEIEMLAWIILENSNTECQLLLITVWGDLHTVPFLF